MLLIESALRSVLLGLLVWALLKLLRVRDTATETVVWTAVLSVALSMPLLSHYLPRLVVAVPHLAARSLPPDLPPPDSLQRAPAPVWLAQHWHSLSLAVYVAGLLVCSTRLGTGLLLSWRLYARAVPVRDEWARGRRIRASATLRSPASVARTILLPADFPSWSAAKCQAVLAHEAAHIARGDFFVQLAAAAHSALFWFSPFAWWLRVKLSEVAETASDEAAARRLDDPLMYAEILLEVARGARGAPLIIAMAKGPLIQQRIDRLLAGAPHPVRSLPSRMIVMTALGLVVLPVTTVTAAVGQGLASASPQATSAKAAGRVVPVTSAANKPAAARSRERVRRTALPMRQAAAPDVHDGVSYDPRALLDPVYAPPRPYVRVVADVVAADGRYR